MRTAIPLTVLATALACSLASAPALARARVFVASYGNDANPCTFGSPCKTFQHAHDVVDAGGEVTAIDSAGFGPINITKAVTITSPDGVEAGIVPVAGGDGIDINAGANDAVTLHGLTIDGGGVGTYGIVFNSGKSLTIENCIARNLVDGLHFVSTATTTQTLAVSNSYFNDNSQSGIFIATASSGAITAAIDRTGVNGNSNNGMLVFGAATVTGQPTVAVTDSVAANNVCGFCILSDSAGPTSNLSLTRVLSEGNATGVKADGVHGFIWLAQSTLTGNAQSFFVSGGGSRIFSYLDNYIAAANGPPFGSSSSVAKQ
jgi:hypothetical protein